MSATIHHPACPSRGLPASAECVQAGRHLVLVGDHDIDHCAAQVACLCGPEAEAEDQLILQHRSVDAMVLDVFTHATQALNDFHENTHSRRGHKGLLACVVLDAELPGPKAASWGVRA